MESSRSTAKDFFLWAGAMLALWGGVIAFIALLFSYVNYVFPNELGYWEPNPYQGSLPYEMASLIVLAPVFLILMRVIRRGIEADRARGEVWVRRWALFLTLFIAGATIVVDLIVLFTTFLSGEELTTRFLLKVLVVLLVAGAGFMHFLADLWGYWLRYPERARYINWGTGILVALAVAAGFFIVGTPGQAREMRLDDERVSDLYSIQSQITYYYQQKQVLPASLSQLQDPLTGFVLPLDPKTGASYRYEKTADLGFRLCATFARESAGSASSARSPYGNVQDNWQHGAGEVCFDRMIDPDFYPPYPKGAL